MKNIPLILTLLFGCVVAITAPIKPASAADQNPVLVPVSAAGAVPPLSPAEQTAWGAKSFISTMSQKALSFLADPAMSQEQKAREFQHLLESSFDMNTISRFALGRYWRTATPEQRKEYQDLFRQMVLNVYSERFDEYSGQEFVVRGVRNEGESDAIVSSFVVSQQGPEIQVDWRVRHKKDKFKIIDVMVEGVSMTVTQRSDFASVIQRGGGNVAVLIDYLRSQ